MFQTNSGGYGLYLLISLPALILGFWAQMKVQSTYKKYSQVSTYTGVTGSGVARHILDSNGLQQINIEQTGGTLTDHYDPRSKILRLSAPVYQGSSIASAGVAAHEAGHALQHKEGYGPLKIRSLMIPTVTLGSWLGPIVFMLGLIMASQTGDNIAWIGIAIFSATALFSILTVPVELDATRRAKSWLLKSGALVEGEMSSAGAVLDAAAWTYVAGAVQSLSTVLYYVLLLLGRRRRN